MSPGAAAERLRAFEGAVERATRGERAFFLNEGGRLPGGAYFATIRIADDADDRASRLGGGRWRLSFGPPKPLYIARFGQPPKRPAQGGVVAGPWDFAAEDAPTPHPVYGWMGWMAVVNPTAATLEALAPLIAAAWEKARGAAACRLAKLEGRRC
jgi:hypothetical protein